MSTVTGGKSAASSQQTAFTRQATILRRNLLEWDMKLHDPRGEDWPRMLGRLNAAMNQTTNMDRSIEDVMEHFVYLPRQATANPQDIPFFLSTKLDSSALDERTTTTTDHEGSSNDKKDTIMDELLALDDPVDVLAKYEERAAKILAQCEEEMVRF
jgi:hypothetical protein